MILKDFYDDVGGDYNEVIVRLGKEERIIKYLLKFSEADALGEYDKAFEEEDYPECFRILHSLKGMCLNLGLTNLEKSSTVLCEQFRHGVPKEDITELSQKTRKDFDDTIKAIRDILHP